MIDKWRGWTEMEIKSINFSALPNQRNEKNFRWADKCANTRRAHENQSASPSLLLLRITPSILARMMKFTCSIIIKVFSSPLGPIMLRLRTQSIVFRGCWLRYRIVGAASQLILANINNDAGSWVAKGLDTISQHQDKPAWSKNKQQSERRNFQAWERKDKKELRGEQQVSCRRPRKKNRKR